MTWFLDKEYLEKLDLRGYDAAAIAKRLGLDRDVVAAFVDPLRRYTVQSSNYGWLAGANGDARPTLVFLGAPRLDFGNQELLNAVSFDVRTGAVTTRAIPLDDDLLEVPEAILGTLKKEIGFVHVGYAPVLAFKHPELWHYALVPFPFDLHDIAVGAPEAEADDPDQVRAWIEDGSFVVHCGNAYYLDADGEVRSS
jgi:hypothetical protein